MLVIPNEKITSGILTNYSARTPIANAEVMIVAGHEADPHASQPSRSRQRAEWRACSPNPHPW